MVGGGAKIGRRRFIGAAALLSTAAAGPAASQAAVIRPRAVLLRPDATLKDLGFLPGLTRRLDAALRPPVRTEPIALDLRKVPRDRGLLLAEALVGAAAESIAAKADPATPQIVLIADDMRLPPANFNFAISRGGAPTGLVIVSLARLAARDPDLTAARVARMALKNIARVLGHPGSGACVFDFPRSLAELDAMPETYCEPDLGVLRAAGIAR